MTRRALALPLVLLALPAGAAAVTHSRTVSVDDDFYGVQSLSVKSGTTVKWVWRGDSPHNVTVKKGPKRFRSSIKSSGTFSQKLVKTGTYEILCTVHTPDMQMTVVVR